MKKKEFLKGRSNNSDLEKLGFISKVKHTTEP